MGTLALTVNERSFDYDIHSLVQAFFPGEEVKVTSPEDRVGSTEGLPDLQIRFEEDGILFSVLDGKSDALKIETAGIDDRSVIKNFTKQLIYHGLVRYTGRELPWGALTGIRPVKLVRGLLKDGASEEEVRDYMKTVYLIGDRKLSLSLEIARREQEIIDRLNKDSYSLYVGIPFCPTRCLYCSFASYPVNTRGKEIDPYLEALFRELALTKEIYPDREPDTVYIGGGTPTALDPEHLRRLLEEVAKRVDLSKVLEFTVEAGRPDSITEEKLRVLKEFGVTRISVNPQTMNEETLKKIGRAHTAEDIVRAFHLARETGFDNINMDIILGLPDEGEKEVSHTLEEIRKLAPDSLTVHSLAVKRASALAEYSRENGIFMLHNSEEIMKIASEGARDMGLLPYYLYRQKNMAGNLENTGFAKPGRYGIYNVAIMEEVQDILALGAGTVSKHIFPDGRIERTDAVKELSQYMDRIDEMTDRKRKLFERM